MAEAEKGSIDLARRIRRVRESSSSLAKLTDELNASLQLAESALIELQLGVEGAIDLEVQDAETGESTHLAFQRYGSWGLFIVVGDPSEGGLLTYPLMQASRTLRLAAADALQALTELLVRKTEEESKQVAMRVRSVQDVVSTLTKAIT